jgi:hypothetical protein
MDPPRKRGDLGYSIAFKDRECRTDFNGRNEQLAE